jgi:hypothetical protein
MIEPDESPQPNLVQLVLATLGDIASVPSAFDAELLVSTVSGSVYRALLPDRADGLASFLRALAQHIADTEPESPVGAVLAAWTPSASAFGGGPAWIGQLGRLRCTGTYAYGDRYGDQTSYIATYAYDDEDLGGPEHAIVVLADHNTGMAKDLFVAAPAATVLAGLRADVTSGADEMTWFSEIEPSTLRTAAGAYLTATDNAAELPESDSVAEDRTLVEARLRLLAAPPAVPSSPESSPESSEGTIDAARAVLIADFLASPEADLAGFADLAGARRESLTYCLALMIDFASSRGDAMRWSPVAVETFLGTWVHQRAILDDEDAALLPDVLRAWVAYAGRRVRLPEKALAETLATVRTARTTFARLHETGEARSPAARAMTAMIADGVDLTDLAAVNRWLETHNGTTS